jgi:tRNA G18 (ribose-2'-O)-methylase SpoU
LGAVGALIEVGDPADPRLVDYVGLTDVARRRALEPAAGLFLAEGEPVLRRALDAGFGLRSMLVDPKRLELVRDLVEGTAAPAYLAAPAVLEAVTGFNVHRGVLASFARKPEPHVGEVIASARRLLVTEAMTSTTNLGAVLRSAAALGIDGVVLSPDCCDPLYRRCVRVSMGESLRLPLARARSWPGVLDDLRAAGFAVLALTPDPSAVELDVALADVGGRVALLLGAEGTGLTPAARAAATCDVRIPMSSGVDSLNVAAAAAIACFLVGRTYPHGS